MSIWPEEPFLDETASPEAVELGAALMFVRRYGARTPALIDERVATLQSEGDRLGAALWLRMGERVAEILKQGRDH